MENLSVRYTTQVPKLVSQQFDEEIIIANYETGIYYSLVGTGADIWLGLKSGASVEEIATAFANCRATGHSITQEQIIGFVEKLQSEGIIAPCDETSVLNSWAPQFRDPGSPPALDRFDDLRDLLVLDPVHDVSDAGWPLRAQNVD
jgi:hypothetical protein